MAHRLREFRFTKAQQARLWELMEPDDALLLCVEGLIDNYAVELGDCVPAAEKGGPTLTLNWSNCYYVRWPTARAVRRETA